MNSYFFKMNKQEKANILDQHKSLYDGYVTRDNTTSNQTPLYIQDLANDKNGITLNNKGVVKHYMNVGINEGLLDMIADGPRDLKNGTVDFDSLPEMSDINTKLMHDKYPSPNEDEEEFVTYGKISHDNEDSIIAMNNLDDFEYDIDELEDYSTDHYYDDNNEEEEDLTYGERLEESLLNVDKEVIPDLVHQLYESMHMFERFKKYN